MLLAIAGAGPVAQAFGKALRESGFEIACVASRDLDHARVAATFIGTIAVPYREIASRASHALIAVSDRAITPVAEEIARNGGKLQTALHTCGSYGPEALAPLAASGVSRGAIHPFQTIRDATQGAAALKSAAFSICGDQIALSFAETIASALSGNILRIEPEGRPLYHAAAVMASNYIAAIMDSAENLMRLAGVSNEHARRALAPLARTG
ncbi:MAG: DUF2520 domain-containing protein, partial [Bryobacteraceae bacterium]